MAIRVHCPACAAEYQVADRLAGKKIRCTKCQAVVAVPGDADGAERPVDDAIRSAPTSRQETAATPSARSPRRNRDEDDDAPSPIKKGSSTPLLLILGGVGLLVLLPLVCCGGGVAWFLLLPTSASMSGSPAASSVSGTAMPTIIDRPIPPVDKDRPDDVKPVPVQPPKEPPPDKPKEPPPPVVAWTAQPDPLPAGLTLPEKPQGAIPITGYPVLPNTIVDEVVYPTSPSPFVSVAVKGPIVNAHEVWDLRTMQRVGLASPKDPFSFPALSPDGAYFAVPTFGLNPDKGVDVYGVSDGHAYQVKVTKESIFIDNFDFAGPGQVLTLRQTA